MKPETRNFFLFPYTKPGKDPFQHLVRGHFTRQFSHSLERLLKIHGQQFRPVLPSEVLTSSPHRVDHG